MQRLHGLGPGRARVIWLFSLVFLAAGPAAAQVQLASPAADPVLTAVGGAFSSRAVSENGRFVAFSSAGKNVAPGQADSNNVDDVFLLDRTLGTVRLVSHLPDAPGTTGNGASNEAVISKDGAIVAFVSSAVDLVPGSDTNGTRDVFLFEVATGTVTLVTHVPGSPTTTGNGYSYGPALNEDGRRVAFHSQATNLVVGQSDSAGSFDIFLHDRPTGEMTLVSHVVNLPTTAAGNNSNYPQISDDGDYVAFESQATNLVAGSDVSSTPDVFLYSKASGLVTLVSHTLGSPGQASGSLPGGAGSFSMSADGAFIAFTSGSTGMVSGQWDDNALSDVFLFRRDDPGAGTITLVSHQPGQSAWTGDSGSGGPIVSADGAWVAFNSQSRNLAGTTHPNSNQDVFLFARSTGTVTLVSHAAGLPGTAANSQSTTQGISADGRYVSFESTATNVAPGVTDGNTAYDSFLYDATTGDATLVSHAQGQPLVPASPGTASMSAPRVCRTGELVVFYSTSADVVLPGDNNGTAAADVFAYDVASGANALVTTGSLAFPSVTAAGSSQSPSASQDGRYVAFVSDAPNLVPGQVDANRAKDVFLYDQDAGTVALVSHVPGSSATTGNLASDQVAIAAHGDWVAFGSIATDLVAGTDANGAYDLFLYERATGTVRLVSHVPGSVTTTGNALVATSGGFAVSDDGAWIVFASTASDLIAGGTDTNNARDVFLYERATQAVSLVSHAAGAPATAASAASDWPVISGNGGWIAFQSVANNLLAGYSGLGGQVYLFERGAGVTRLVSHADGTPASAANAYSYYPSLSSDGGYLAYESSATNLDLSVSDTNGNYDIYVYDREADANTLASHVPGSTLQAGNAASRYARISSDGSAAVFLSEATNLAGGADSNGGHDVFLYDREANTVTLVSHKAGSAVDAGNNYTTSTITRISIASDGSRVGFSSQASDLVAGQVDPNRFSGNEDTFVFERSTGLVSLAGHAPGAPTMAANERSTGTITRDGSHMALASWASNLITGDGNGLLDVFLAPSVCRPGGRPASPPSPTGTTGSTSPGRAPASPRTRCCALAPRPAPMRPSRRRAGAPTSTRRSTAG